MVTSAVAFWRAVGQKKPLWMPCRQGPSTLCGSHICLHVSLPTAPVLPPGECTSISHCLLFSVQDVVDELIHGRPTGYFLRFFLLLRKLLCLEESDGMLCPCRSLGLGDKDQRHFFCHGSGRLYGQGLTACRNQSLLGRLRIRRQHPCRRPPGLSRKVLAGPDFFCLFCSVDGSTDG